MRLGKHAIIKRPTNAANDFFLQLLRDEIFAAIGSAIITAIAFWLALIFFHGNIPRGVELALLPLVGPITEKPFLFLHYTIIGFRRARNRRSRGNILFHLQLWCSETWQEIVEQDAIRVLRVDIIYHDSCYSVAVFLLALFLPPTGTFAAGLTSFVGFFAAVWMASVLESQVIKLQFELLRRQLIRLGFEFSRFNEVALLVRPQGGKEEIVEFLELMSNQIAGDGVHTSEHFDYVVEGCSLPEFNDWSAYVMVRKTAVRTRLHIIYVRKRDSQPSNDVPEIVHFYEKCRFALTIDGPAVNVIEPVLVRIFGRRNVSALKLVEHFHHHRYWTNNAQSISYAIDVPILSQPEYSEEASEKEQAVLCELKVWPGAMKCLFQAVYDINFRYPAVPTNQNRLVTPEMVEEFSRYRRLSSR